MKSRISKILGVVVALATLASLLVGTALPTSAAAPGALAWAVTDTPSAVGNVLTAGTEATMVAAAANGTTIFAYDDAANKLYKSVNAGATWAAGVTVGTAATAAIALKLSPNFATDNIVVLAEPSNVWLSVNGGTTFADVANADLLNKLETGTITSMDVSNFYSNNTMSIIVGVTGGTGLYSNVLKFTYGGFTWDEVGTLRQTAVTATATATFTLGTTATATATIAGGIITAITLGVGGSGYVAAPIVTITDDGTTHATATATLTGNAVSGFTITNGGVAITVATVAIAAPTTGTVTAVALTAGGSGYWAVPAVSFSAGGGTGAAATAAIAGGAVTGFTVTANGSLYTSAPTVTIAAPTGAGVGNFNVVGVKFSPSHMTDAEIMCVYTSGANAYLSSKFGTLDWNAFIAVSTAMVDVPTKAIIAVGSDYVGNTGSPILVGLSGGATDNLFRVTGRAAAGGTATTLSVNGMGFATSIRQVDVSGPAATATILYSVSAVAAVRRATGGIATFTAGTVLPQPSGTVNVWPVFGGTTAFAGTLGADSAVSRSLDGGATWGQVGLINVTTIASMSLLKLTVVDANTMFLVMNNAGGTSAARSVFKTIDAGVSWVRILTGAALAEAVISPAYATDSTLIVIDGTNIVKKSTNGGSSFADLAMPAGAAKALMLDNNTFYVGGVVATEFFKSGSWSGATGIVGTVYSIALNPKDATKATMAVGTTAGTVYQSTNGGVSFTVVGVLPPGAANITVAYGPDGTLYAADSAAGAKYYSATLGWVTITAGTISDLILSGDGTLYASSSTASTGVYRSLAPASTVPGVQTIAGTVTIIDMAVLTAATANSIYIVDTSAAVGTYLYAGRVYGYSDTLIVAMKNKTPTNAALLPVANTTTATVAWDAFTGATTYEVTVDGVVSTTVAAPAISLALTGFVGGSTHTWSYRVTLPLNSRQSPTWSFTTALPQAAVAIGAQFPTVGAVDIAIDTTFTWPIVTGATGYEFVIAEDLGETDKFAIIDYSATTTTNAHKLRENLKYNTTYWWRVRAYNATTKGDWGTGFFTTAKAPVTAATTPAVVVTQVPAPQITLTIPPATTTTTEVIPAYLLWAVIAVGAVLVIVVIVLIVRTRRIS
jgi:hypothetical protein